MRMVDDLSDDRRRHHSLQGAGAGDPGSRHRRATTPTSSSAELQRHRPEDDEFYIYLVGPIGGG